MFPQWCDVWQHNGAENIYQDQVVYFMVDVSGSILADDNIKSNNDSSFVVLYLPCHWSSFHHYHSLLNFPPLLLIVVFVAYFCCFLSDDSIAQSNNSNIQYLAGLSPLHTQLQQSPPVKLFVSSPEYAGSVRMKNNSRETIFPLGSNQKWKENWKWSLLLSCLNQLKMAAREKCKKKLNV